MSVNSDYQRLRELAEQAKTLLDGFLDLEPDELLEAAEAIAELENIISEFRRLRPLPPFKH